MNKIYTVIAVLAIAFAGTSFAATNIAEKVAPTYYPYYNMPEVLVFSGVAVDENNAVSTAVFIALDKQQIIDDVGSEYLLPYKTFYIIVDGKATQLKIKSMSIDKETQTIVAHLEGDKKDMTLIVKQHTTNYQNVVVASGTFDGYLLNMKLYNNENIYTIMPATETKATVSKGTSHSGGGGQNFGSPFDSTIEEAIAKIGKK